MSETDEGTFICLSCRHELPDSYCVRTPRYCYMCDPNITLEEALDESNQSPLWNNSQSVNP